VGDDAVVGDPAAVEVLEKFQVTGLEAAYFAEDPVYRSSLNS